MVVDNKATVTYVQLLKEDLVIIRLVPKEGPVPEFQAGQFITLGLPNPVEGGKIVRRAYSIASHPENRDYIELVIRWVRKPLPGRLTTQLFNLKEGDEILWLKPTGKALTINEELPNGEKDNRRIVCIGGGTGLAPFVSFAQHFHDTGDKREIIVLQGASFMISGIAVVSFLFANFSTVFQFSSIILAMLSGTSSFHEDSLPSAASNNFSLTDDAESDFLSPNFGFSLYIFNM